MTSAKRIGEVLLRADNISLSFGGVRALAEISLDIQRCPALPRDEVLRLAALELDARIVPSSPSSSPTQG